MPQLSLVLGARTPATTTAAPEPITLGACVLRGFALPDEHALLAAIDAVTAASPPRHLVTPGGLRMSVASTSCGALGWMSDARGYRYQPDDPLQGAPWPAMPDELRALGVAAAARAGFASFAPDSCLVNRYEPGARMTLHQDRNERDFTAPIVSVSLGLPATFLFGGGARADRPLRIPLDHGDVVVWGGPARLRFHGILPLRPGWHPLVGGHRINLTFRRAG